ncbi:hypothetical protein WN944_013349 [Citrus x changshan-huyou]|uniref:Uncharacterized protein n=1 Tax=Citrus x changshan-huyou TaxID=2935761 RepID=A0AAP0M3P2_9ROSI
MERIELVLQEQKQEVIREKYNIPKVVELRIPKRGEKLINPLVGTGVYKRYGQELVYLRPHYRNFRNVSSSRITQENMRAVLWGDQPKVSAQVRSNVRGAPLSRRPYTDLLSLESFQASGLVALHEAS